MITLRSKVLALTTAGFIILVGITTEVFAGPQRAFRTLDMPVAQVMSYQEGVGLLNTMTGEIFELRGDLDNASSRLSWFLRV